MLKRILLAILILVVAIGSGVAFYVYLMTQTRPSLEDAPANYTCHFSSASACEKAKLWLQKRYENFPVPSISAAISVKGKQVWSGTIGMADIAAEIPAQRDTQYQIGSISKSLTAALTMKLQEQGLLSIENDFQFYVNDFAVGNHANYTLKQLLSHQSGIRHYKDELSESLNETAYANTREAAGIVENDPLAFTPGSDFLYTSYAYSVLALALEEVTNQPFNIAAQERLLDALKMQDTALNLADTNVQGPSRKAKPYLVLGSSIFEAPKIDYSNKYAGAGFLSTPSDLLLFGEALMQFSYLNESSIQQMFTPQPILDADGVEQPNPQNYALGFRADKSDFGKMLHHGGTINGGYSFFAIYPESEVVVAFAMNAVPPLSNSLDREASSNELVSYFLASE